MRYFLSRLSTRLYLALALSLSLVLLVLISVSIKVQQETLHRQAEETLLQITDVFKTSLELVLQTRQESLRNLAANLERWQDPNHPALEDDAALRQLFDHIWVVNRRGDVVDEWPRLGAVQERLNISSHALFSRLRVSQDYIIGYPEPSYYDQQPVIHAAVPMVDDDGSFLGAVLGMFSLYENRILNRIVSTRIGERGYVAVATGDGVVIAHPDRRMIMRTLTESTNPLLYRALNDHWEGVAVAPNRQGIPAFQTVRPLAFSDWVISATLEVDDAMEPAYTLRRVQLIVGAASIILSLALLSWILKTYMRPLRRLHQEVSAIQQGHAQRLTEPGVAELRKIVARFNELLQQNEASNDALMQRQAYLDSILATSSVGLFMTNRQGKILYTNQRLFDITGFHADELMSQQALRYIAEEYRERFADSWSRTLEHDVPMSIEMPMRRADGELIWLQVQTETVYADGHCIGHVGTVNNVTRHHEKVAELKSVANQDELTGLLNRRGIEQALAEAFKVARENSSGLLLLALDLDNFKAVNDSNGHEAGDWVLSQVAQVMLDLTRESDWTGRLGGDEFLIIIPACPLKQGQRIAQELITHIASISGQRELPQVTASIGLVSLRNDDQTGLDMLRRADKAAYAAKHAGRNQIVSDDPNG